MAPEPSPGGIDAQGRIELGHRLRDLRLSREWTLQDLAERVGASVASVSAYERGTRRVSLDDLRAICAAFEIAVSDLLADVYPYGTKAQPHWETPPPDGRRSRT